MSNNYDSTQDTKTHISRVVSLLDQIKLKLKLRGMQHDCSKLIEPEKKVFDRYTPLLKNVTYGSDIYKAYLSNMQVALDNHYAKNKHHPEHYTKGIDGMSLIDVMEMLCDWKAASERHNDGDVIKSVRINAKRFNINEQLTSVLLNTIKEMEWE